jgi:hypothetical protein
MTTNRPSPSHSAVVLVASSSPPRAGHFRLLSLRRQWLSAGGGLSAGELARRRWFYEKNATINHVIAPECGAYNKNNKKATKEYVH